MTKRIAFIGAAGSGKSTLAAEVFVELKKLGKNVELITEWVRSDIHLHGPLQTIWEQLRTQLHQRMREDAVPTSAEYMLTDSGTLTPYFYACLYVDNTDSRQRLVLQDMYKFFLDDLYLHRYSHIFFLPSLQTYAANPNMLHDGTRFQTMNEIEILEQHMALMFTKLHKLDNVHVLDCELSNRAANILKIIS
ncbi:MAG: AAA family ATPase [Richelia sp. RM2_1_2]|nr:AAA family ATPase [Richelia sp. RM2_1_2]